MSRLIKAFVGLTLAAGVASSADAADANHGGELANRWCAACHLVSPEQRQGSDRVPSFASVARQPGFTAERLTYFLLDPHPKMPDMALTRREAEDLAAYIATLKR
jgi:mono/diheme cytochrome c family protein